MWCKKCFTLPVILLFLVSCSSISFSSDYIYGIHWWSTTAKASIMNDKTGWTVETVNTVEKPWYGFFDLIRSIRTEGVFTPIVRINYNWGQTIPADPAQYDRFANDCAEIASTLYNSYGVRWVQIGNEMNLDGEYPPTNDGKGCPADAYVECFRRVYTAIKSRVPAVYVLVGPVGPFNNQGPLHSLSEGGVYYDVYFDYIVDKIGDNCDGYAIHPYGKHTEDVDNNLQLSVVKGIPNSWGFNCFKVYMKILQQYNFAITKPVHATETNTFHAYGAQDVPAYSYTQGWMQESFQKIDDWNNNRGTSAGENPHGQKILSLCWFVYSDRNDPNWKLFALANNDGNLPTARNDFSEVTRTTGYKHNFSVEPQQDTTPPSRVSDLSAQPGNNPGEVILSWTAPGDDGSVGTAAQYDIRYHTSEITESNWSSAALLPNLPKPQPGGTRQTWVIPSSAGLTPGATYYFALKACDEVSNCSPISNSPHTYATIILDTTPPTVPSLLVPEDNSVITSLPIRFKWTKSVENQSPPVSYELQISTNKDFRILIKTIPYIYNEEYLLSSLPSGKYWWRVRAKDNVKPQPNTSAWSEKRSFVLDISIEEQEILPKERFVTETMPLTFSSRVESAIIMDINGSVVATLNKELSNSSLPLVWDGKGDDGELLNSGIYIYKVVDIEGNSFYGTVVVVK